MTSNPSKKKLQSSEKRDTLQINQQQSQEMEQDSDDMNSKQRRKRRFSSLFTPFESRKQKREYIELFSQTGSNSIKFPIYEDSQVGFPKQFQNQLCNPYDMDDDVQTKASVQKYFIKVCLEDLEDGMRINLGEDEKRYVKLKKQYEYLENDIN